jgi:hypothetical protein
VKLPEAVIDHLREIDIDYGEIIINVNKCEKLIDVSVKKRERIRFNEKLEKLDKKN